MGIAYIKKTDESAICADGFGNCVFCVFGAGFRGTVNFL
jgi:hypothetical protein